MNKNKVVPGCHKMVAGFLPWRDCDLTVKKRLFCQKWQQVLDIVTKITLHIMDFCVK